ncbi:site-specific DNA-methyltransferase (adenine-specific) [Azospirillum baldaniorum]|uniref:DNA methyltransferase n=1 Tax=Azospirillum baldaniorum TaxID=1064539 RepID=UPI0011ADDF1F|nr:DNA methyltransferase [Azospirillum baldaniorum]TWA71889.1 site-specific DNA-methyltransferase (adenine-specific) [Azospirillum baldaniorum]
MIEPVIIGGGRVIAYNADCRDVLRQMTEQGERVHTVCSDPPYHLTSIVKRFGKAGAAPAVHGTDGAFARASKGFMGKQWDGVTEGELPIAFDPATWALHLDALVPGGYITAFSSSRGFGEMSEAIRSAGFVIHPMLENILSMEPSVAAFWESLSTEQAEAFARIVDSQDPAGHLSWLFGSGMPKATRLKAPDTDHLRYGGQALKPALEPIFMGQKPMEGTGTENWLQHGTGPVNIDAARIDGHGEIITTHSRGSSEAYAKRPGERSASESGRLTPQNRPEFVGNERTGRWPANVLHDGSPEVLEAFGAFGERASKRGPDSTATGKTSHRGVCYGNGLERVGEAFGDSGSAARFFYEAKASKEDRWFLCRVCGTAHPARAIGAHVHGLETTDHLVQHPTVKPLEMIRWLVRLTAPERGQTVWDGFAGTGSTAVACLAEGRRAIVCERDPDYFRILVARCRHYAGEGSHTASAPKVRRNAAPPAPLPLLAAIQAVPAPPAE